MARPSRGCRVVPVSSVVCTPAPAPEIGPAEGFSIDVNPFDSGLPPLADIAVNLYQDGVFYGQSGISAADLAEFGTNIGAEPDGVWTVTFVLPNGGFYCPGETAPSNTVSF